MKKIIASGLLICFLSIGCSTKVTFPVSNVLPAATAESTIKQDKNGNYIIQLDVAHMAGPDRLQSPKSAYVVWAKTDNGAVNLGQLIIDKGLSGHLESVNSNKPTQIFITAEDNATVRMPGSIQVISSNPIEIKD